MNRKRKDLKKKMIQNNYRGQIDYSKLWNQQLWKNNYGTICK